MFNWTGQKLGNYQILRLLGQGGFADVYLGQHVYLNTYAAIKVLQARLGNSDLQTFLQEARTVASLTHSHIVRVLEFGEEGHTPYLIMDYCPNGTLRQRHPKGARVSLPECVTYINQVAEALQYAHDRTIIHRDVKPENMLIGQNDTVLLSDFGIAIISQSSRSLTSQNISGTIAYSAPEQLQGHAGAASDQYALGIVLYEWLCGELPYQGSLSEIAGQHLTASIPTICDKGVSVPLAVEQVLQKALAKDPQQRYQHVRDFAAALELAREGKLAPPIVIPTPPINGQANVPTFPPTQPAPYFPSSQPPSRKGKTGLFIAIIVVLILALVGVSSYALFFAPSGKPPQTTGGSATPSSATATATLSGSSPTATATLPGPSPTASAGTITVNRSLTCACNDLVLVTITTITIDTTNARMVWNVKLTNKTGGEITFNFTSFTLQDTTGMQWGSSELLGHMYMQASAVQNVQTIFAFVPYKGGSYTLTAHVDSEGCCGATFTGDFDPMTFTF